MILKYIKNQSAVFRKFSDNKIFGLFFFIVEIKIKNILKIIKNTIFRKKLPPFIGQIASENGRLSNFLKNYGYFKFTCTFSQNPVNQFFMKINSLRKIENTAKVNNLFHYKPVRVRTSTKRAFHWRQRVRSPWFTRITARMMYTRAWTKVGEQIAQFKQRIKRGCTKQNIVS